MARHLKASTRESYAGVLRSRVLPRWGDRPLPAVGHADVAGCLAELSAQGPSAARVRACFLALSSLLDVAVRDGRLTDNPAATGCFVR